MNRYAKFGKHLLPDEMSRVLKITIMVPVQNVGVMSENFQNILCGSEACIIKDKDKFRIIAAEFKFMRWAAK